jgi:chromosome segregation ATPase
VIELEKEKAELLSKLNTLLARQQQQEAPQNQQSTDSNASRVLLVKRISDLENELNATRETLATVTAELQQFRQQPTLQHEYTALSAQYQQLETANRDLRNEVDRLQKQLAQLQQNTQQPQQQTSDEVKEIEELRRQLKLSTELIEQLLMEQTKSEQRVHAAERRLKELQQELDTLRQHRKQ